MKVFKNISFLMLFALTACDGSRLGCEVDDVEVTVNDNLVSASASVLADSQIEQYNWEFSDGFQVATIDPFVEHLVIGNGDHVLNLEAQLTNGNYCTYVVPYTIDNNSVNTDTCDIDISHWELMGNKLEVGVEVHGDPDDVTYQWKLGDGNHKWGEDDQIGHVYAQKGTYHLSVSYQSTNGCSDTTTRVVHVDSITVLPPCEVQIKGTPQINGKTVSIAVKTTNVTDPVVEYIWDMGDNKPPLVTTNPNYIYTYSQPGYYKIEVQVVSGTCQSSVEKGIYIQ